MNPILARVLVYGLLAGLLIACGGLYGYRRGELKLFDYQAKEAAASVAIVTKQGKVTEKVVNRYIKVKGNTQVVTKTIEKEVVRYAEVNPGYCLDAAWGRLHDAAATNTVPQPSSFSDGAERAPTAAGALETVTASYAACNRTADKLDALQSWVREQATVTLAGGVAHANYSCRPDSVWLCNATACCH